MQHQNNLQHRHYVTTPLLKAYANCYICHRRSHQFQRLHSYSPMPVTKDQYHQEYFIKSVTVNNVHQGQRTSCINWHTSILFLKLKNKHEIFQKILKHSTDRGNTKSQKMEMFWNTYPDTDNELYSIWFSNLSELKENKLQQTNSKYCCKPITSQWNPMINGVTCIITL